MRALNARILYIIARTTFERGISSNGIINNLLIIKITNKPISISAVLLSVFIATVLCLAFLAGSAAGAEEQEHAFQVSMVITMAKRHTYMQI